ncbi:MAG: hypothetical protein R3B84_21720 [Zavarzinella sp.]
MTVFGKILVFMIMLLSVATGAMIVYVLTTRANWKAAYDDMKVKAEAAEVAYKKEKSAHDNDLKAIADTNSSKTTELETLKQQFTALQAQLAAKDKEIADAKATSVTDTTLVQKFESEMKQLREERDVMAKDNFKLQQELANQIIKTNAEKKLFVEAKLEAETLKSKLGNVSRELGDLQQRYNELETRSVFAGGASGTLSSSVLNPPAKPAPLNVSGKVVEVGTASSGLAVVSIGSDSGLSIGNVLIVYRDDLYLGELTLTQVEPKFSAGKFSPARSRYILQKGDPVTTGFSKGR